MWYGQYWIELKSFCKSSFLLFIIHFWLKTVDIFTKHTLSCQRNLNIFIYPTFIDRTSSECGERYCQNFICCFKVLFIFELKLYFSVVWPFCVLFSFWILIKSDVGYIMQAGCIRQAIITTVTSASILLLFLTWETTHY